MRDLNPVWAQIWKTRICVWSRAHSERSEQGASELGSTEGLWVSSRISFSGEYQNSMHTWTRAGNPIEFRTGPITSRFNSPRGVWSWCEALATFWLDLLPNKRKWKLDSCSGCDSCVPFFAFFGWVKRSKKIVAFFVFDHFLTYLKSKSGQTQKMQRFFNSNFFTQPKNARVAHVFTIVAFVVRLTITRFFVRYKSSFLL